MEYVLVLIFTGVAVAAVCQALTGIGFALVASPILIFSCGYVQGRSLGVVLGLIISAWLLVRGWRHLSWRYLILILGPAAITAPAWVWVLTQMSEDVTARVAGAIALVAAVVTATNVRPRALLGRGGGVIAGTTSSALVVAGGIGGPPLAMYAVANGWSLASTRATLNAYFFILGLVMLYLLDPPRLGVDVALASAGLLGGILIAVPIVKRVTADAALKMTLLLAGASGVVLLALGARA